MNLVRRFLILVMFLTLPAMAFAQEATMTGTVTDSTGAVLPGVTVTAVNEATGNTFTGVTDERGIYRIPLRVGTYRISVELQGFTTVQRTGVQLLVGQTAIVGYADVALNRAGDGDGYRGGAAAERHDIEPRRQRRSDTGAGAAGQRPQLDGAGAAGARAAVRARRTRRRRCPTETTARTASSS